MSTASNCNTVKRLVVLNGKLNENKFYKIINGERELMEISFVLNI